MINASDLPVRAKKMPLASLTVGRSVTVFADQLMELLILWFVWELTRSSTIMAIATFAGRAPFWLFAFYGATLVDRFGPFRLLKICNMVAGCLAFVAAGKLLMFGPDVVTLVLLSFGLNATRCLEAAALTAAAPLLVPAGSYHIANSWFDNAKRFGRLTAPLLSRWIAVLNPGMFVVLAGVAYFGMSLISSRSKTGLTDTSVKAREIAPFSATFSFVKESRPLAWLFGASAVYAFFHGAAYFVVLPRLSFDLNPGSPASLGILITLIGVGGIVSNIIIASLRIRHYSAAVGCGMIVAGVCFALFALEPPSTARMILALLAGAALPFQDVFITCTIQALGPPNIVARLHATWRLTCEATISLGILFSGLAVDLMTASWVGIVSGIAIVGIGTLLLYSSGARIFSDAGTKS